MTSKELGPGSEGDAYRYTKKVLLGLPNMQELRSIYSEVARNRNVSSWTRACYEELRRQFFRDGQCKIKFAPGVARIAFGELYMGNGDEDFRQLADLRDFIRIISIAHFEEYTRHLVLNGETMTYEALTSRFGNTVAGNWKELKKELSRIKYGPRRYKIIWLDRFETGKAYYKYTEPHGWCHLNSASMFRSYSIQHRSFKDGSQSISLVKLYLAVLPGFETMTEDDPLYGESMLGIDIGPDGRLMHVNNRWNHAHDNIDERKGDNKYSERELSELLGGPFYKLCPPLRKSDCRHIECLARKMRRNKNESVLGWAKGTVSRVMSAYGMVSEASESTFVDERDGIAYPTVVRNGIEWMRDPLAYVPVKDIREDSGWRKRHQMSDEDIELDHIDILSDAERARDTEDREDDFTVANEHVMFVNKHKIVDYPCYSPLTKVTIHAKEHIYADSDVLVLNSPKRTETDTYLEDCKAYRIMREGKLGPGCKLGVGAFTIYEEQGFVDVLTSDGHAEYELITPLGFERSYSSDKSDERFGPTKCSVMCDDKDSAGYVAYSTVNVDAVLPEGWRIPTVEEFLAMALQSGADLYFCDDEEVGRSKFSSYIRVPKLEVCPDVHVNSRMGKRDIRRALYEAIVLGPMERKFGEPPKVSADKLTADTKTLKNTIAVIRAQLDDLELAHPGVVDRINYETNYDPDDEAVDTTEPLPQEEDPDRFGIAVDNKMPDFHLRFPCIGGLEYGNTITIPPSTIRLGGLEPNTPILLTVNVPEAIKTQAELEDFIGKFGGNGSPSSGLQKELEAVLGGNANWQDENVDEDVEPALLQPSGEELPRIPRVIYAKATYVPDEYGNFVFAISMMRKAGSGTAMIYPVRDVK